MLSLQIEHTQAVNGGGVEGGALTVVTMKSKEMESTWSMKLCHNRQTREKHIVPRSSESGILDNSRVHDLRRNVGQHEGS